MFKILVVDDHPVVGEALRQVLTTGAGFNEIEVAHTARAARDQFRLGNHDLVIVDLDLPDMAGIDLMRCLRMRNPSVKVLVYTSKRYEMYASRLRAMNICGFVKKTEPIDTIATIVALVAKGYSMMPAAGAPSATDNPFDVLSTRELSVASLICKGQSNRLIAQQLCISQKTVAVHKMNLLRKLGAESAIDVAQLAQMHGLD